MDWSAEFGIQDSAYDTAGENIWTCRNACRELWEESAWTGAGESHAYTEQYTANDISIIRAE